MMELFGLVESRYSSISGVSMVPGTFNTFSCFHLHSDALLAQPTRWSPRPASPLSSTPWSLLLIRVLSTGSSTLRVSPPTTPSPCCSGCCPTPPRNPSLCGKSSTRRRSPWWESSWTVSQELRPRPAGGGGVLMQWCLSLTDGGKTLTFFNNDYRGDFQTVTFEGDHIRKLFYGSFHKVRRSKVTLPLHSSSPLCVCVSYRWCVCVCVCLSCSSTSPSVRPVPE